MNNKKGSGLSMKTWIIIGIFVLLIAGMIDSATGNSSSSYQLHNKDGSLNYKYVADMWEWQAKQKNK